MYNFSLLTLLSFCVLSCKPESNADLFTGNWYTCGADGYYVELYAKNGTFQYCSQDDFLIEKYMYHFAADTLLYKDPYFATDSLRANRKAKITFIGKNEMKWDFLDFKESVTFFRLKNKIAESPDEIKKDTKRRAKERRCPGFKPKEEQSKDSLDKMIYFQF